jgi:hypothetical protein
MLDHVFEAPAHVARAAPAPFLAIDAGDHIQVVGIGQLVDGDQTWSHHVAGIEILALGRSQHAAISTA